MELILSSAVNSIGQVWVTLQHSWLYLVIGIVIATALKLYVNAEKVSAFLNRYRRAGVVAATTVAVATPLCSCGTTAVVLGMMATTMPWAPIVAFMVSSPLTSPEGLVYSAGIFGWPFALAFFLASIVLGLSGGWVAAVFERRGWLANQTRFTNPAPAPCACPTNNTLPTMASRVFSLEALNLQPASLEPACAGAATLALAPSCGCVQAEIPLELAESSCGCSGNTARPAQSRVQAAANAFVPKKSHADERQFRQETDRQVDKPVAQNRVSLTAFANELFISGKRLLVMFAGFAFIGYFLNGLIPASWVASIFGSSNIYNVPLAATLGLPFYINSEASLPLIRSLLDAGMSQGAALAFLISGAGTSIGAITGALTIARWRVVALVVGVLWIGAIISGFAFDLALSMKMF